MSNGLLIAALPSSFFHKRTGHSCVEQNNLFCPDWVRHHIGEYVTPTVQHFILVGASVGIGFVVAFGLAVLAHRRRWLVPPLLATTGVLYTIPSLAFFFLLLPLTGRGRETAIIALTAYTLQIIFRNIFTGLNNVPAEVKDAARGMGLTDRQLLWRVELPLAVPEIIAGLRIAVVSTVAIATLAVFANGGGLGTEIYPDKLTFKTGIVMVGLIVVAMAFTFDVILLLIQRAVTPWRRKAQA
jgi:osmoprotectant transport system permease protein